MNLMSLLLSINKININLCSKNLNIPESSNYMPDILNEAMYNIKWMMTMQDTDVVV